MFFYFTSFYHEELLQAVVLCKVIMLVVYSEVVINGGLVNHYVFHIEKAFKIQQARLTEACGKV